MAATRKLHPALAAHGAKVKAAHAVLAQRHGADFTTLPPVERMKRVQAHIRKVAK